MERISEQWSKANTRSQGRTDANLSNDSNHLGGIPADEYATKEYVQEYHDTKEGNLKDYVDRQDQSILNEAKEYTNSQIRNQDFSDFAKLTDVQALDNKLSNEIEEGLATQKSYTDSKTQAIVDDVNANFQDVENSINTLNGNMNELFQSVSSGKGVVAEAITDKGVPTSASDSFNTMATNIRAIPTSSGGGGEEGGGGEDDPNYVNTGDATATAADILLGKTAYAKGEKIYGTFIAQAEEGYPTYGTDTSNATATEADIAYGKTAYARGQLLIGTAQNMSPDVEEIYGLSSEDYNINNVSNCINPPDGEDSIYTVDKVAYSQNGDYCVRRVSIENGESSKPTYIESFAINDDGLYYQASSGTTDTNIAYKKYRYSLEELGIVPRNGGQFNGIYSIALGTPGFGGDSSKCVLAIIYGEIKYGENSQLLWDKKYLRLLTYHLNDNGIIGKAYESESNYIDETIDVSFSDSLKTYYADIVGDLNDPLTFYMCCFRNDIYISLRVDKIIIIPTLNSSYTTSIFEGIMLNTDTYNFGVPRIFLTSDNNYCYILGGCESNYPVRSYICNITNNSPGVLSNITLSNGINFNYINTFNNKLFGIAFEYSGGNNNLNFCEIINANDIFTVEAPKTIILNDFTDWRVLYYIKNMLVSLDKKRLILLLTKNIKNYAETTLCVYNLEGLFINNNEDDTNLDLIQTFSYPHQISSNAQLLSNINGSRFFFSSHYYDGSNSKNINHLVMGHISEDTESIIGVKYKNKTFYSLQGGQLTAGGPDVRAGKTYIGWQGYPETGIAEF